MNSTDLANLMQKQISEASSTLQRGLAFYLAIIAAATGYLSGADLGHEAKCAVAGVAASISLFTAFSVLFLAYGIWVGLKEMATVATSADKANSRRIFKRFVQRGRISGVVVVITLGGILMTFLTAIFLLLQTTPK